MSGLLGCPAQPGLSLPAALRAAILDHALASPDVEVCGLLGGLEGLALTRYPVANVADEPATTFLMDARGQLGAMKDMRARGEELVGIYHSHPASPPTPSARDLAFAAYPGVAYLIVSLAERDAPVLAAYLLEGAAFRPLALQAAG